MHTGTFRGNQSGGESGLNIRVYRRNDKLVRFKVRDKDGDALSAEGASFLFVAGPIVKTSEPGGGIAVRDEDGGIAVEFLLTDHDTDIDPGHLRYELLLTDVEGARYTLARGFLSILHSLTTGRD